MIKLIAKYGVILLLFVSNISLFAQCPQLNDFFGTPNSNPYWYSCTGANFNLNINSPNVIGNWTINWGDGSPLSNGVSLIPGNNISHLYIAAVDTFNVVFTETSSGCVINGVFVMEQATSASIQIPVGGLTQTCAPSPLEFINSSTNTSQTTVFTWNFGDGSPALVTDFTNIGQTISHTYLKGSVNCVTQVTLSAENYCNTIQGGNSVASFNPIRIWDIDDATINASATLLCYPDTQVTFSNSTNRNCLAQGNIAQRYEWWNFGDYWGAGHDSIVGWVPWPPALPYTLAYPGIGTYNVMMVDSSFCGVDTAYITIQIVSPPFAALTANKDTICEGESVTFNNLSGGGANSYFWNFGDGSGWNSSAGGNVNHIFNNSGDYIIKVVAIRTGGSGGCRDTASVNLHVLNSPVANFTFDNNNACDSMSVNFTNTSSVDAISWNWDFGNTITSSLQNPPMQFYGSSGNYNVQLTVQNLNGCSHSITKPLKVYQSPIPAFTPTSVCVNSLATFIDNSTSSVGDPIITWSWNFDDGFSSTQQNPNHIYNAAGFYNMILTVNTAFCSGMDTIQINVESVPLANFTVDTNNGCADLLVNFTNTSSANAVSYSWNYGDGSPLDTNSNSIHTFTNTYGIDTTYQVLLVAQTTFGCRDTVINPISVYPNPNASFTDNAVLDCAPLIIHFTNTTTGSATQTWNFGDSSPLNNSFSPTHTFQNTTLFIDNHLVQLIALSANGCADTATKNITVYPQPQFGFSINPDSGCSPLIVSFPSVIGAVVYNWDFGDATTGSGPTPSHTFANNLTNDLIYNVTLTATSPFGCKDTTYGQVLVFPNPTAQFMVNDTNGCHPFPIIFTNSSTGGTYYHWNLGDGTTFDTLSSSFIHMYNNISGMLQNINTTLIAETDRGCKDTATQMVSIYPDVTAILQADTFGCSPFTTNFTSLSIGAVTHYWDFGDGSPINNSPNPTHQFINTGIVNQYFNVRLIIESIYGCFDTTYQQILVYPPTLALFNTSLTVGCQPLPITINNNSSNGNIFHWNLGDGTTFDTLAPSYNYIYSNNTGVVQNYTITLVSETNNGCLDTASQLITVYPEIMADFSADTVGCSPFTSNFLNNSIGETNYFWDFGDGSPINNSPNPTHQFINTGVVNQNFNVRLIIESIYGCLDTTYQQILVYPPTLALFNTSLTVGCQPLPITINNNSSNGNIFHWDLGNGTTFDTLAPSYNYIYSNNTGVVQNYTITLVSETNNGCLDTASQLITVYPEIIAVFFADSSGCSPLPNNFVNTSIGANTFIWNFGDGSALDNTPSPSHVYTNTTPNDITYSASLIAESFYGCRDTLIKPITVYTTPVASFIASPASQAYPSTAVAISNTTSFGTWQYNWSYGDTTTSTLLSPPNHIYSTWGNYTLSVIVSGLYCSDTATQTINIIPPVPVANFQGPETGCRPLRVQFINNSLYANQYNWNFGNGDFSTQENPNYTYYNPGIYSVTLTATGDGGVDTQTQSQIIEVYQIPSAFFTATPSIVTIPSQAVTLFNLSSFASSYKWDFGDGVTSTEINPQHFYLLPGFFDVSLIATSINNCKDTFRLVSAVEAKAEGDIKIPNAFTPNPGGSNGGIVISGNLDNDVFHPIIFGAETYELNVFNKWGELLFISKDIKIGWDGYYREKLVQQDVYVYKIQVTFVDGRSETFVGDITLLR